VRRIVFALIGLGLVAIVVIGLAQSEGGTSDGPDEIPSPTPEDIRRAFADAPPALDRLHARANEIIPGGRDEYERQLDALKGHPVVVNFWGSWCAPCRLEFPVFQQQAVKWGDRVAFLGVNAQDNRAKAKEFLEDFPLTFPSVEDGRGGIAGRLGARGYPTTAFYDADGERVFVHQGPYETEKDLADDIREHLRVR
jgi:thiol-disulfide isomerase/thioredoxin